MKSTPMTAATYIQCGLKRALERTAPIVSTLRREESGQDLIEYALIVCFLALSVVASTKSLVTAIIAVVSSIGTTLTSAT